jgi:hypothetical protein
MLADNTNSNENCSLFSIKVRGYNIPIIILAQYSAVFILAPEKESI